jgi:hypothetical protein
VSTKRFNEQVRRNRKRMFQLTAEETSSLRSQFATLKTGRGQHRKYAPYVFTEHGAIIDATILNSHGLSRTKSHTRRGFGRPVPAPKHAPRSARTAVCRPLRGWLRSALAARSPLGDWDFRRESRRSG